MLSDYYVDAKQAIEVSLESGKSLAFSSFRSPLSNQATVEAFSIEPFGSDESGKANIALYLQYREFTPTEDGRLEPLLRASDLVVLSSSADTKWTPRMRSSVWNNRYPDTVAIDKDTGEVYLLFVERWGIELRHFSRLPLDDLEGLLLTIDENAPFHLYISQDAMFRVLDGCEGYNHLLDNLYIEFSGARKVISGIRKEEPHVICDTDVTD